MYLRRDNLKNANHYYYLKVDSNRKQGINIDYHTLTQLVSGKKKNVSMQWGSTTIPSDFKKPLK